MTFFQRVNLAPVRNVIQVEPLGSRSRSALWNLIGHVLSDAAVTGTWRRHDAARRRESQNLAASRRFYGQTLSMGITCNYRPNHIDAQRMAV